MNSEDKKTYVESDAEAPTRIREGYVMEEVEQEAANERAGQPTTYVESDEEAPTRVREGYMMKEIEREEQ